MEEAQLATGPSGLRHFAQDGSRSTVAGDDTIFTTPARGFTVKDLHDAILVLFEQEL